uniref:Uncharacterized protein n=1 Tax=Lactuca sativa TaxID=4236 RepID=A0A9R1X7H3_LACSA|nr:hypothetical protein LSAT_V11C500258070 [Lactuca sativa]
MVVSLTCIGKMSLSIDSSVDVGTANVSALPFWFACFSPAVDSSVCRFQITCTPYIMVVRELEKLACSHCYSQIQVPNTYIIFILKTCILLVASVEGSVSLEAI